LIRSYDMFTDHAGNLWYAQCSFNANQYRQSDDGPSEGKRNQAAAPKDRAGPAASSQVLTSQHQWE